MGPNWEEAMQAQAGAEAAPGGLGDVGGALPPPEDGAPPEFGPGPETQSGDAQPVDVSAGEQETALPS